MIPLAPATLGAPLDDGLSNALASQEIAAFDALGAPFQSTVNRQSLVPTALHHTDKYLAKLLSLTEILDNAKPLHLS